MGSSGGVLWSWLAIEGQGRDPQPKPFGCLPARLSCSPSPSFSSSLMKNTKEKCASAQVWEAPARGMEK